MKIHIFHEWIPYKQVGSKDICIVEICKECFKTRNVGHNFKKVEHTHFECMDSNIDEEPCSICGGYCFYQSYGFGGFGADHGFVKGDFFIKKNINIYGEEPIWM